jgi:hypothetical protein
MLIQVDLTRRDGSIAVNAVAHHMRIDSTHRPVPCSHGEADYQRRELEELSGELLDRRTVRRVWRATCRQQICDLVFGSYYALRKRGLAAILNEDIALLRAPEHRRWIYGFLPAGFL